MKEKIKVMEYNILHGFYTPNFPFVFEEERQKVTIEVVKKCNPDILVLTEACYGKEFRECFVDYQSLFGFPHHYYAHRDYEHGVSILSKYPIIDAQNYSFGRIHFVRCQININGKTIYLDVVHPHPSMSEKEKTRFIKGILRDFKMPYILTGDFNACSKDDPYIQDDMIRSFSKFNKHAKETVNDLLTFQSIEAIESKGLIDTYKVLHPNEESVNYTVPTDLLSKDKGSGLRCDLIFCSDDFKVKDSGVIKNDKTEVASDHYPVFATLEI